MTVQVSDTESKLAVITTFRDDHFSYLTCTYCVSRILTSHVQAIHFSNTVLLHHYCDQPRNPTGRHLHGSRPLTSTTTSRLCAPTRLRRITPT